MSARDWHEWHNHYDEPDSVLARRLVVVQGRIAAALNQAPAGPIRVLSLCAGQGRDIIPVAAVHPRRDEIRARLVELDPRNAEAARAAAASAGLAGFDVVTGDASLIDHCAALAPADLTMLCGIFGNISDEDIEFTIGQSASLTRHGGTVLWTRHRRNGDLIPQIDAWFHDAGFTQDWISDASLDFGVGSHRFLGEPAPLVAGTKLFDFVGRERLRRDEIPNP